MFHDAARIRFKTQRIDIEIRCKSWEPCTCGNGHRQPPPTRVDMELLIPIRRYPLATRKRCIRAGGRPRRGRHANTMQVDMFRGHCSRRGPRVPRSGSAFYGRGSRVAIRSLRIVPCKVVYGSHTGHTTGPFYAASLKALTARLCQDMPVWGDHGVSHECLDRMSDTFP